MVNAPSKKVLIFLPFLTYGGAEKQGFLLAQGLQQAGWYVEVWGFKLVDGNYPLIEALEKQGIAYKVFPYEMKVMPTFKGALKALFTYAGMIRAGGFNAVIPFTFWPNFLTGLASRFVSATCFWNQRSVDDHVPRQRFEKFIPTHKLVFVSNSNPGADFVARRFGIARSGVSIIPNSIVEQLPLHNAAYWKDKLGISATELIVTMTANFFPEKDFDTVLDAAAIIKAKKLPVKFLFIGGGPNKLRAQKCKTRASELGLTDSVVFLDNVVDVSGVLAVSDIGLLSSRSEGCPNSILEYMMAGLPVLANDIVAISDVLGHSYPYLFKTGHAESLVEKLMALYADAENRKIIGSNLRAVALSRYNQPQMIKGFTSLIS